MKPFLVLSLLLLALAPLAFGQNFSVQITPLSTVVLPDTGGTLSYVVTVTNLESVPRSADVWVKGTMPNGVVKPGPGPTTQTFLGNQSLSWNRQADLAPSAPVGYYTLHAYVGLYPNTIWNQTELQFQKQMLTGGVEQEWVARFNGPGNFGDFTKDMAVDGNGNIYITGYTYGVESNADYVTLKYNSSGILQWTQSYNGPGNYWDIPAHLVLDSANNVYVTGQSWGERTEYDYCTIKYDSNGVQQWVSRYNGTGNDSDMTNSMAVDGDGNVYVTGFSFESTTYQDYTTIKYNAAGIQQWVTHYNGPANSNDEAYDLVVDQYGNVYVTGTSQGSGTGDDYATLKYDAYGTMQWIARYNGGPGNSLDVATNLAVDGNCNVYVTGYSGIWPNYDYATVKYDASGSQIWEARYNGPGNQEDIPQDLALDIDGNVYLTGTSSVIMYANDCITIKYDNSGNVEWIASYNGPSNFCDVGRDVLIDNNNNVYVTGSSYGGATGYDYMTIKYDAAGIQQWVVRYNGPGNYDDFACRLALVSEGNLIVTGESDGSGTSEDFATIKYSQPAIPNWQPVTATMLGAPLPQECRLEPPSPNPFNPTTAISFKLQAANHVSLRVYDTAGRLVTTLVNGWREAGTHEVTFDGSGLSSGMYFVQMQAGEYMAVQKMVLLK